MEPNAQETLRIALHDSPGGRQTTMVAAISPTPDRGFSAVEIIRFGGLAKSRGLWRQVESTQLASFISGRALGLNINVLAIFRRTNLISIKWQFEGICTLKGESRYPVLVQSRRSSLASRVFADVADV